MYSQDRMIYTMLPFLGQSRPGCQRGETHRENINPERSLPHGFFSENKISRLKNKRACKKRDRKMDQHRVEMIECVHKYRGR